MRSFRKEEKQRLKPEIIKEILKSAENPQVLALYHRVDANFLIFLRES
jgi:hypothetical protein